ncbi:MAG TPA: 5-amino-6-(D-ribitylamino)uracil--L-tyrosine 4-hydroxyphenyl transferase CofH [Clostridia bacterium]|nr:5-amino-6-(D-ribitylamino)uracil--L-tyrosine 4-hydroxyphenyl transferase CofH [Clostridia bacterium]
MVVRTDNSSLDRILGKCLKGQEITCEEGASLLQARGLDVWIIAQAADELRRRTVGDRVTYVKNRNVNFTNVCTMQCGFCAFSVLPGRGGYTMSVEQVKEEASTAKKQGCTEVCLQGGINPALDYRYYLDICKAVKDVAPDIHIHAFSPMEIKAMADKWGVSVEYCLDALKDAGLGSIPGTAAEILDDGIRRVLCPKKISTGEWVSVVKAAHKKGIPTTATMMYGHIEDETHRARHLDLIRSIQKETGGFTEFIPLSFIHYNTRIYRHPPDGLAVRQGTTGLEDIKVHAVSRLMLAGAIDHIQVSWPKLGPKLAQMCLDAGCDDLGGTLFSEKITSSAGGGWGQSLSETDIRDLILGVGRVPAERDTIYRIVDELEAF